MANADRSDGFEAAAGAVRRRRWPAGMLGMLALVLGVELMVDRHEVAFLNLISFQWHQVGRSTGNAAGCDVLVLGDSLMKHDLIPQVIEARVGGGRRAYNLAMPGGSAPTSYFMLRRTIAAGNQPKVILTDGETHDVDPMTLTSTWPELLTPGEVLDLSRTIGDAEFLARTGLQLALPTMKLRPQIRAAIGDALAGKVVTGTQTVDVVRRNLNKNRGAFVLAQVHDPALPDPRLPQIAAIRGLVKRFEPHPLNLAYTLRMLELARTHGIEVVWVLPPYHPAVQSQRDEVGRNAGLVAYVSGLQARFPNLSVASGLGGEYPAEILHDVTHLNRNGAVVFSDAIGRYLRRKFDAPDDHRWTLLGRYNRFAADALTTFTTVEDSGGSFMALEQARLAAPAMLSRGTSPAATLMK